MAKKKQAKMTAEKWCKKLYPQCIVHTRGDVVAIQKYPGGAIAITADTVDHAFELWQGKLEQAQKKASGSQA